jgi:hypothetical protein
VQDFILNYKKKKKKNVNTLWKEKRKAAVEDSFNYNILCTID